MSHPADPQSPAPQSPLPPSLPALSRRDALRAMAALVALPPLSTAAAHELAARQAGRAPALRALTPAEFATVEALSDTIIPDDEHSPGAKAARVADYVDVVLAEAGRDTRAAWATGLVALDAAARAAHGVPFAALTAVQRGAVLTPLAAREAMPTTPLEQFFRAAKEATIRGYYTSEIGLRQDLQYKGNTFVADFPGCTHETGPGATGHGPRANGRAP